MAVVEIRAHRNRILCRGFLSRGHIPPHLKPLARLKRAGVARVPRGVAERIQRLKSNYHVQERTVDGGKRFHRQRRRSHITLCGDGGGDGGGGDDHDDGGGGVL